MHFPRMTVKGTFVSKSINQSLRGSLISHFILLCLPIGVSESQRLPNINHYFQKYNRHIYLILIKIFQEKIKVAGSHKISLWYLSVGLNCFFLILLFLERLQRLTLFRGYSARVLALTGIVIWFVGLKWSKCWIVDLR